MPQVSCGKKIFRKRLMAIERARHYRYFCIKATNVNRQANQPGTLRLPIVLHATTQILLLFYFILSMLVYSSNYMKQQNF